MAMNELRKEVEAAAMAELNRANAKFPLFNSTHEGYAVILEEAEEAQEAHMAIYAVDFDGTLAVTRFPEIVEPKRKIVAAVKMLKANGHKVILWTSRAGRDLEAAVEWCHGQGLEFDAVNEPLPEQVAR